MTLEARLETRLAMWLEAATGDFSAGVRARLAQEYRAHLEESVAAGGTADPAALFGEPDAVRTALSRTYLTRTELDDRAGQGEGMYWLATGFVFLALGTHLLPGTRSGALVYGLMALGWTLLGLVTQRWPQPRRSAVRAIAALPALFLLQVPNLVSLQLWASRPWELLLGLLLLGFGLYTLAWQLPRDDARLRRTLALEPPV